MEKAAEEPEYAGAQPEPSEEEILAFALRTLGGWAQFCAPNGPNDGGSVFLEAGGDVRSSPDSMIVTDAKPGGRAGHVSIQSGGSTQLGRISARGDIAGGCVSIVSEGDTTTGDICTDSVRGSGPDYRARFERDFVSKRGTEFENWFQALMVAIYPDDFERSRPFGSLGDAKCDGYLASEATVFQVYAPDSPHCPKTQKNWEQKVAEDFRGAREHWPGMRAWVLVHNHPRGTPGPVLALLRNLEADHPDLAIRALQSEELWRRCSGLSQTELQRLFPARALGS